MILGKSRSFHGGFIPSKILTFWGNDISYVKEPTMRAPENAVFKFIGCRRTRFYYSRFYGHFLSAQTDDRCDIPSIQPHITSHKDVDHNSLILMIT